MGEATLGMTMADLAGSTIELIKGLFILTGFPAKIPADVAKEKDIPDMVKQAMSRQMVKFDKRKSTEREQTAIYRRTMEDWD